jgi:hypothetical protein
VGMGKSTIKERAPDRTRREGTSGDDGYHGQGVLRRFLLLQLGAVEVCVFGVVGGQERLSMLLFFFYFY